LRNIFSNGCNNGVEGVEATFAWTAPEDGTFSFSGSGISLLVLQGVCTDPGGGACSTGGFGDSGLGFGRVSLQLAKGDQVTIVVDTASMSVDTVSVVIVRGQPTCGLFGCSPPPSDAGQGSEGGNDQGATICLDNAAARGETLCSGVECVCHHCPQDYDDCAVIPGCKDIRECMRGKNCIGTECYNSGSCRAAVDSFAGVSGPAFKAAVRVQSCELSFQCALPCGADAGSTDAGVPSSDAGRLCEPGRKVACDCEGGTGTKTCSKDGNGYEACACGAPKPQPSDSGCGCRVAGPPRTPPYGLGAALAVVLACARRRPRRIARGVAT
jgi:MYXO-CTERM domain-containing protein